ncbi:hypothetical protein [Polyangium mundeleinium]|uniref:Lipoprotein n=1 Tax=Polyangium mundeleinium TaxID=2995306 RepID=A0ABT5F7G3_9BACT|nr:hypothetical protein [Polyangium mundeleinium]MDC0749052.1 hypothetical protein [Polyangium mundeleinium]
MTETGVPDRILAMTVPRVRTFLSLGLLGWATAALIPLGCGAKITYPEASEGPRVPDATAERLRECVDAFGGDLPRGKFTFDVVLSVDEGGHVVDVKSKGVPHEELAICMRIALRSMTIPEELLRLRKLRLSASPAPANVQRPAERGLVGNPAVLVAVAITLADLIIEAAPVVIVVAASVELGKSDIAKTARKKDDDPCQEPLNDCLDSAVQSKKGSVWNHSRCKTCFEKCRGEGKWPDKIMMSKWETCK